MLDRAANALLVVFFAVVVVVVCSTINLTHTGLGWESTLLYGSRIQPYRINVEE